MAKDQNLSLNPTKISGNCGRLMCCLKNEEAAYEYLNSKLPDIGDHVYTKDGEKGEVIATSVLRQRVKVVVQEGDGDEEVKEAKEYDVADLKFKPKKRHVNYEDDREARKLEALERNEGSRLND